MSEKLFQTLLSKEVTNFGQAKSFPAETAILTEDSYIKFIPIVLEGSLKVLRTEEDGREILLYYIKPGESCIMSFLSGLHNETSKIRAVVEEDARIL